MIWVICGTRPELIKLWPVVAQLHVEHVPVTVVFTGQHTDLAHGMPLLPDVNLAVPGCEDPYLTITKTLLLLQDWATTQPLPRWIVVQGDTASAVAGARLAEALHVPLCHVEAGLRSYDKADPWPEELFRVEIDRLSTLKCCPTSQNQANLVREGLGTNAYITGNPITDALRRVGAHKLDPEHVLMTLHRRESFGNDLRTCLERIFDIARVSAVPFLWPIHPNPNVRKALEGLEVPDNVHIVPPLPYRDFLTALCHSYYVITDSGGLVEETTTLGIPCQVTRNATERPESAAMMVGRRGEGLAPWPNEFTPMTTFGDGHAAPRITTLLRTP